MVEIQSVEELREIKTGSMKGGVQVKIGKSLQRTLEGLDRAETTVGADIDLSIMQDLLGVSKTVDFLYLVGVYGINEQAVNEPNTGSDAEESSAKQRNRADIVKEEKENSATFWESLRNHFAALGYTEEDKDTFGRLMMIYIGSSENRDRLKLMTPTELNNEILRVFTPRGYRTKMEGIYERSFGRFSKVGSNNKNETGHILGLAYDEEFAKILAACSEEIGNAVAVYNSNHAQDEGYVPVRYVPYTAEKMHTTIAVDRKPADDMKRTRKNTEQGIILDETDEIWEESPAFEVQGVGSSADTVIVKTLPKDGRQLGLVQKTVLEGTTDSGGTIGYGPLSHITLGRFVTDNAENIENIGKPAVRVLSDELVQEIQEIMKRYTAFLLENHPIVTPRTVFSGNFDLNTVGTSTPTFELNKKNVVPFKNTK